MVRTEVVVVVVYYIIITILLLLLLYFYYYIFIIYYILLPLFYLCIRLGNDNPLHRRIIAVLSLLLLSAMGALVEFSDDESD